MLWVQDFQVFVSVAGYGLQFGGVKISMKGFIRVSAESYWFYSGFN